MKNVQMLGLFTSLMLVTPPAFAGSPHFVDDTVVITTAGSALSVSGKEAGLGNESQVHIVLTATALCINPGGNHPRAVNKSSVEAEGDFPVQNGKAVFALSAVATFQPECVPPMSVDWADIKLCDTTHEVCF